MSHWDGVAAGATNLRLFEPEAGWRCNNDEKDAAGRVTSAGSNRAIELALSTALNASNLIVLTGAGSSFCAVNPSSKPGAPAMSDLWDAVAVSATAGVMAASIALIPNAAGIGKNIEKLLTLCKLYGALFNDDDSRRISSFIETAEKAILKQYWGGWTLSTKIPIYLPTEPSYVR